jgi:hypothetical protein
VTALDYLKYLRDSIPLPLTPETMKRQDKTPSTSELKRWLEAGSVQINGANPKPYDPVSLPIWHLVFFPKGRRRTYLE